MSCYREYRKKCISILPIRMVQLVELFLKESIHTKCHTQASVCFTILSTAPTRQYFSYTLHTLHALFNKVKSGLVSTINDAIIYE